jgi:hypothetical protein
MGQVSGCVTEALRLALFSFTAYFFRVLSAVRQILLLLTAVAFMLATVLPASVIAMPMPNDAMTGGAGKLCTDCPDKTPLKDGNKMGCGALACAGVAIALPARQPPFLLSFAAIGYSQGPLLSRPGAPPAPDPFPPRPTVLV